MKATHQLIDQFASDVVDKHLSRFHDRWKEILLARSKEDVPPDYVDAMEAIAISINRFTSQYRLGWWKKRKLLNALYRAMRRSKVHPFAQTSIYETVMVTAVTRKLRSDPS